VTNRELASTGSDEGPWADGVPWPAVSVVIPTLNEAFNLPYVFGALPHWVHEVIVVDGRSTDETVAVARRLRPDVRIVEQTRRGKGNALACGFAAATGEIIVTVDADGSNDPLEIESFVRTLLEDGADYAKGTRFGAGGGSSDITRIRRWGNRCLNGLVNRICGTRFSDLCYGYNAFWRQCLQAFQLDAGAETAPEGAPTAGAMPWGDGFEIETLLHLRATRAGLNIVEVPSFERARLNGSSNLNAVGDGLRVLRTIAVETRRRAVAYREADLAPVVSIDEARREAPVEALAFAASAASLSS
jgi:glycosyltransferase involved in cell wall biosynthesis